MPVKAYVWLYESLDDPGHVSLELSDGTYISWWPKDSDKPGNKDALKLAVGKTVAPDVDRDYDKDKKEEKREPKHTFKLKQSLNEKKMKAWWERMKEEEKYSLFSNNCCTAAKKALKEGGLIVDLMVADTPFLMMKYFENNEHWE